MLRARPRSKSRDDDLAIPTRGKSASEASPALADLLMSSGPATAQIRNQQMLDVERPDGVAVFGDDEETD